MWFKKKSVLQAEHHYNTEKSADGSADMRTTSKIYINNSSSINSGLPSAADAGNYFYLPALGSYSSGQLVQVGISGYYWSSSAAPWYDGNSACYMNFNSGSILVHAFLRNDGYRIEPTFK